jgi:hypothetical protein
MEEIKIEQYLEDLENRIDHDVEEELLHQWETFLAGKMNTGFFSPRRQKTSPTTMEWPKVTVNDTLNDFELMAIQQLSTCSATLANGTGSIMNVRANYGTGILSSVFGAEIFLMDDKLNTLPTTRPLGFGADSIKQILDEGIPDLDNGFGERCFTMGKYFVDLFAGYTKVSRYIRIYHPDLQGPMDVCELLWGSEFFLNLIETPDLVHAFLRLITETYIRFMHAWEQIIPSRNGYSAHWGMLHKGRIMIRDDSAMNLSQEMFYKFIKPYDQRLLHEFGGGAIHFCGRGDHYVDYLQTMAGLFAVHMSQPECNDMERIFRNTINKGIILLDLQRGAAEEAMNQGRNLHGRVHCW